MFSLISMVILWSAVVVSEVSSNVCQGSALKYRVLEEATLKLSKKYKNIPTLETDTPIMDAESPPYIFCSFTVYARWTKSQEVCTVDCMFFKGDTKPTDVTVTKCKIKDRKYRKRKNDHPTSERRRRQSTGQMAAPQQTPGAHYGTRPRYQSDPTPPTFRPPPPPPSPPLQAGRERYSPPPPFPKPTLPLRPFKAPPTKLQPPPPASRRPALHSKPHPSTTTHADGQWNIGHPTGRPTTTQGHQQQQQQRPQRPKLHVETGWTMPGTKKPGGRGEFVEGRANQKTRAPRVIAALNPGWQIYY